MRLSKPSFQVNLPIYSEPGDITYIPSNNRLHQQNNNIQSNNNDNIKDLQNEEKEREKERERERRMVVDMYIDM